jgi:FtsH-binding integral membrane protein
MKNFTEKFQFKSYNSKSEIGDSVKTGAGLSLVLFGLLTGILVCYKTFGPIFLLIQSNLLTPTIVTGVITVVLSLIIFNFTFRIGGLIGGLIGGIIGLIVGSNKNIKLSDD